MIPCESCKWWVNPGLYCRKFKKRFSNGYHALHFSEDRGCVKGGNENEKLD